MENFQYVLPTLSMSLSIKDVVWYSSYEPGFWVSLLGLFSSFAHKFIPAIQKAIQKGSIYWSSHLVHILQHAIGTDLH